ncbi:hypothetical protein EV421DRAFT_1903953 [Armillaria borealis]|uniref:Uncharacterized protein n=1 Tax=Armillaria borealis TaxID=47425 RepID=A0AA39JMA2_9AGAR|nr:hypothetical protein EV421DRAFT_1903953 [Armillaria borealis]
MCIHQRWFMAKFYTFSKKSVETAIPSLQVAAAGLTPVPALGLATDIILSILEIAYQSQQNAGTSREIANRCLRARITLSEHLQGTEITPRLLDSIRRFEADLHDVQETVERYKHKKRINRFFYSKSYNDDLQRLGKRIDETLSVFQINKLLSLDEVCVKIYTSVQRLEAAPRPEGASVDIVQRNHFTPCEEIINGPGYSLQKAEMRSGNIVTIRVFTGCKAKSTWEALNKFDLNVMHPNLPHLIGTSSSDERGALYSVYDLDIKDSVEGVIVAKMSQDVDEIIYMCARVIHGISSALNNLSEQARLFDMGAEDFDIFWDARGRVVLAIHPEVASSSTALVSPGDHTLKLLGVMDGICSNIFRTVNHTRYDDHPERTVAVTTTAIPPHEDISCSKSLLSRSSNETAITPRRELFWQLVPGRDTNLRKISQECGSFMRLRQPVRRLHAIDDPTVLNHHGTGYRREELILTDAILDNNVVVHSTPPSRVFFWNTKGQVERGVVRSTFRHVDGTLMLEIKMGYPGSWGRNIVLPAAGVSADPSQDYQAIAFSKKRTNLQWLPLPEFYENGGHKYK